MHNHSTKELNIILAEFGILPITEVTPPKVEKIEIKDIRANENNWSIV